MKLKMNQKERVLATMAGEIPDRVPVQLGITNMFSIYQQKLSGWDVYAYSKVPIWKIVTDTQRMFGLDGYLYLDMPVIKKNNLVTITTKTVKQNQRMIIKRTTVTTPDGDIFSERTFFKNEEPTTTIGFIKNEKDFNIWLKYCIDETADYDTSSLKEPVTYLGNNGVTAGTVGIPGMAALCGLFDGKLESATYFYMDYPELIEEYAKKCEKAILRKVEQFIYSDVDYIQFGSSGMLTLSTPKWFTNLSLPTIKSGTRLCKEAGVLSEVHCCGKEELVIDACYHQTELDSINPLQPPPMGDCDLKTIKQKYGDKLCLKGNVGVTEPLLFGTADDVEKDVIRCMEAAKEGGRYILFSEEGIGANTPIENVKRFIETGKKLGKY